MIPKFFLSAEAGKTIVCLCHDVSLEDIHDAVGAGFTTPETIKRYTGALMGPCQGRSCADLVLNAIAETTAQPVRALVRPTSRPPTYGVRLGQLAGDVAGEDH